MNDSISRQAAINGKISVALADGVEIYSEEVVPVSYLKQLPSADTDFSDFCDRLWKRAYDRGKRDAEAERKKGKWIYNSPVTMKCNQCGLAMKDWDWHRFKFCPRCGSYNGDNRGD